MHTVDDNDDDDDNNDDDDAGDDDFFGNDNACEIIEQPFSSALKSSGSYSHLHSFKKRQDLSFSCRFWNLRSALYIQDPKRLTES